MTQMFLLKVECTLNSKNGATGTLVGTELPSQTARTAAIPVLEQCNAPETRCWTQLLCGAVTISGRELE
ncbi:hypothetical protein JMJ77_0003538, partial [Colletotrichum scovillei]